MKLVIISTIFLMLVVNSHQRTFSELVDMFHSQILKHSDKCIKESGADRELALRVMRYGEYVDDHKLMCFVRCIADNLHLIYEDGSLHFENILNILNYKDPKTIHRIGFFEKCFELDGSDQCEKMYRISECMYKTVQSALQDEL